MRAIWHAAAVFAAAMGTVTPASAADILVKICNPSWDPRCRNYPPVTTAVPPMDTASGTNSYTLTLDNLGRSQVEAILNALSADKSKYDLTPGKATR
jgi:hypothetical protein